MEMRNLSMEMRNLSIEMANLSMEMTNLSMEMANLSMEMANLLMEMANLLMIKRVNTYFKHHAPHPDLNGALFLLIIKSKKKREWRADKVPK